MISTTAVSASASAGAGGANDGYERALEAALRPHRHRIQAGRFTLAEQRRALIAVFAETVVVAWDGVRDRDGNEMDFSAGNVARLLADLPDLFEDLRRQAEDLRLFAAQVREADAKN